MKKIIILFIAGLLFHSANAQTFVEQWTDLMNQGKNYYLQEKYSNAMDEFKKASLIIPTDTLAYTYIINCAQFTKQAGEAFKALNNLAKLEFNSSLPYENCLPILLNNNFGMENILPLFKAANTKFPKNERIFLLEIQLYQKYGFTTLFFEKLNTFRILFPRNYESYLLEIKTLNEQIKDSVMAFDVIKKAQIIFPDSLSFFKLEYSYQLKRKEYDMARQLIQSLIEKDKQDAELFYNLALLYFEEENYDEAIATCQKAINLKPDYVEAIYNVGTFYYYEGMVYNSAISDMTVGQYKEEGKDYQNSALENFRLAKPYFESAIVYNPSDLDAYENLNTINVLIQNIENTMSQNQDWTEENTLDLPLFISNLAISYQSIAGELSKDSNAVVQFILKNITDSLLSNVNVYINQPITTPGLHFSEIITIDSILPKADFAVSVDLSYNYKAAEVSGIELADGAQDKLRFFAQIGDKKVADLQEINVAIKRNTPIEVHAEEEMVSDSIFISIPANYLITIGLSEYLNWPAIEYAAESAKEFKSILTEKYTFETDNIYELYNNEATHQNIRNALIKIKNEIKSDDNLIIYFSGHGFYNAAFDYATWVPYNANVDALEDYIATSQIIQYLSSINAKHIVIFTDACFSESLFMPAENFSFSTENIDESSRWAFSSGNIEYLADENFKKPKAFVEKLFQVFTESSATKLAINEIIYKTTEALKQQNISSAIGRPLNIQENFSGRYFFTKK
jgi:tetratricopeptide (TPR) repeat protein